MSCYASVFWNLNSSNSCSQTPWYLVQDNKKIFYYLEDSIQCGGDCCDIQSGVATASIVVGPFDVWLRVNYENITQLQTSGKNILTVTLNDGTLFTSQSVGTGIGCYNGPGNFVEYTVLPLKLLANSVNTFKVEYNSVDPEYHNGCYAMVELLFECVEPSQSPTPTPTETPPDCKCRNYWCSDEGCVTPTSTPTPTYTPTTTQTPTMTHTQTKTPSPTPSACSNCYFYDVVVTQTDLDDTGVIYVSYVACGQESPVTTEYNSVGTYTNAFCARDCYTPVVCTALNPCAAPTAGTQAIIQEACTPIEVTCPTTFNYTVNQTGPIQLRAAVDLGQTYGNVDVTVSSNNFPEICEIFVGNFDLKVGEVFSMTKGSNSLTKKLGFYVQYEPKTTLDFAVYSEGSSENPFANYQVQFEVGCPYVDGCGTTPSRTPCPTPTPTATSPLSNIVEPCIVSSDWGQWRLMRIGNPVLAFASGRIDNGLNLRNLPASFKFPFYTFGKTVKLQVSNCNTKASPFWYDVYSMVTIWGNSIYFPSNKLVIKTGGGVETYSMLISPYKR